MRVKQSVLKERLLHLDFSAVAAECDSVYRDWINFRTQLTKEHLAWSHILRVSLSSQTPNRLGHCDIGNRNGPCVTLPSSVATLCMSAWVHLGCVPRTTLWLDCMFYQTLQAHLKGTSEIFGKIPGLTAGERVNKNLFFDHGEDYLYITTEKKVRLLCVASQSALNCLQTIWKPEGWLKIVSFVLVMY